MSEHIDDTKMPLLEHLVELRQRLLYAVAGLMVAFVICFYFAGDIFNFLVQPLADLWAGQPDRELIFTALHEKFITEIKVAFFAALFFSFPILAGQLWMFVAPGLYKNEKQAFWPFLIATPILFFIGAGFVYYFIMPVAWKFFTGFEQLGGDGQLSIKSVPKVGEYLSLVMRLIFAFGISFELPVLISLMARAGLATSTGLRQKRKYAIVMAFVAAAILTPPDPLSQLGLAIPIIGLYEISILCARLIERKRGDEEEDGVGDDEADDDQADAATDD